MLGTEPTLFWPIWIAITVLGVFMVIWVLPNQPRIRLESVPSRRHDSSQRAVILAVAFLILFLACYIAGSLVWEDFTYYDNSNFTYETLLGHNAEIQIDTGAGRFWPLGYQEFNLLRHVTHSVTGYHALRIVQLLLLCGILLVFDEELSIKARVAVIILVLITPSILISFSELIYGEANVLLWLVCLAWFLKRFEQTQSKAWAVACVISSQFMLYYKETAFLLLLGFAVGRLLLRCWKVDQAGWDFERLRDPESRLDLCLAFLVVPFLLYYLAAMFPHYGLRYASEMHLPLVRVLASYLKLDLLVWAFLAVVLTRIIQILRHKVAPSPLWDGLALAGICCLAGYFALRMYTAYYLAPVDLIAVLYVGRLAVLSLKNMSLGVRFCALALLALVVLQDLSLSAFRMYETKNIIHAKAEMGQMIKARYESDSQNVKRLFFPFSYTFQVTEFASYLNYLGVPVEQISGSAVTSGVVLVGRRIIQDGPWESFVCHTASGPDPGDLVVVLPDDFTRADELNSYRREGTEPVFSYHPRPFIPQWLRPYINHLHVVSHLSSQRHLPDAWLNAWVTVSMPPRP